jgi:PhoPQ-activated pathogenicity-related protein
MVRAMDCLQAFGKEELKTEVKSFVVTGASKRGWTSWLTAATADKRVKAIAPMVIDTLNMRVQMPHQFEAFGKFSEQVKDYEDRKLLPMPDTTEARKLWTMVDPWVYRDNLRLPKMIINGTNDPYWAQDALNMYWDDLLGEKHVCYVPNAGHGLTPETMPNQPGTKRDAFPMRAINCLAAFARHEIEDKPMPEPKWSYEGKDKHTTTLTVTPGAGAKAVRSWTATSKTKDFRQSKWSPADVPFQAKCVIEAAAGSEYKVILADVDYEIGGLPFTLTTQVKILEPKK